MVMDQWCVAPEIVANCQSYCQKTCTCARHPIYPELGIKCTPPSTAGTYPLQGYRDHLDDSGIEASKIYANSLLSSNACYLTTTLPPGQSPATSCTQTSDCTCTATAGTPCPSLLYCADGSAGNGDIGNRCVQKRNDVPVPYVGQEHGHAAFYKAAAWHMLPSIADFVDFFLGVWQAGSQYDIDIGKAYGSYVGRAAYYALFATGLWEGVGETYINHDYEDWIFTHARPAMVDNFMPGSARNRLGMVYNHVFTGKAMWTWCENGVDFATPVVLTDTNNGQATPGSGIFGVPNPPIQGKDLVLLYIESPTSPYIKLQTVKLSSGSPIFDPPIDVNVGPGRYLISSMTPAGAVFNGALRVVYNATTVNELWIAIHGEAYSDKIIGPDWENTIQSDQAPAVTVARVRLWVFYKSSFLPHLGKIMAVSTSDGVNWVGPIEVVHRDDNEDPSSDYGPDAYYYSGRIWVVFEDEEKAKVVSFVPLLNGQMELETRSQVVAIPRTEVPDGSPFVPYFSFIKFNPHLRLYYGQDVGLPILPLFNSSKLGSG